MDPVALVITIVVALAVIIGVWRIVPAWRRARGTRLVTCPETHVEEAVELDTGAAVKAALGGHDRFQLSDCTRWPERQGCGQECLAQIESSPSGCLVSEVLKSWYDHRECALCKSRFGEINWHTHKPGLITESGEMLRWSDVPARQLHEVLEKASPVCWDCLVVESFIQKNPDKVTFRPGAVERGGGVKRSGT
jgi:hypothetical protein